MSNETPDQKIWRNEVREMLGGIDLKVQTLAERVNSLNSVNDPLQIRVKSLEMQHVEIVGMITVIRELQDQVRRLDFGHQKLERDRSLLVGGLFILQVIGGIIITLAVKFWKPA